MKTAAKIVLILAAVLIVIGGLLFTGALAMAHWDFASLGNAKYETRTVEIGEAFRDILILSDTEDIALLPSEDGTCRVVFVEREGIGHTAAVQDGMLTIESVDTRSWYDWLTFGVGSLYGSGSPEITLWLPAAEYASLVISEDTGDIDLPADFRFGRIDITAGTGDVRCAASAAGPIRIRTDTGDIRLEGVSAEALELTVSTGRVEVRTVACEGPAELHVSTGKAFLTDVSCASFVSDGNTGDLTLENVTASGPVFIERSTGDVRFVNSDAQELTVQTDTGSVTGSLLSPKVFVTKTDTGRVQVPETTSGGPCRITTDTGDIVIDIPGDAAGGNTRRASARRQYAHMDYAI